MDFIVIKFPFFLKENLFFKLNNFKSENELKDKVNKDLKTQYDNLLKEIEKYPKIKIFSKREYESLPIQIWDKPIVSINTQLGEGESILKMIDFSYSKKNDI